MKIRVLILLLTLPLFVFGNSGAMYLDSLNTVEMEMACCSDTEDPSNCCCDSSDQESLPCDNGQCETNGCIISVPSTLFSSEFSEEASFFLEYFSNNKIQTTFDSFIPMDISSIWTPPKIIS